MHTRTRLLLPVAALSVSALALTACSTPTASDAAPAAAPETATVIVADAKPTLVLVEEGGESSYQEDTETARGSVEVAVNPASVVTFDIATLDTLDAIGAGDAVVGGLSTDQVTVKGYWKRGETEYHAPH